MKQVRLILWALCLTLSVPVVAQNSNASVLTIAGEEVTKEEFENIFRKNNRDTVITQQSLDDYMELFINFKLKVREARSLGMDTVAKFRNELRGYREQLARPYMTDATMLDELVREAYAHTTEEVRARHILVKCDPNAPPSDTLNAWNRISQLRARIVNGEDFGAVARESSEDPTAKDNGGELGYFTAFQMVYPFEDAAYRTPVGQVSNVIRTRYGYHILQVQDRRPSRGEVHVAHIMVKEKKEENGAQNAELKIREIYQKLQQGESFEDLCARFSEDGSTSKKGGELPWFGTNKMVAEFEEASFSLAKDGDISEPFKTSYGWHIVKRLGYKPVPAFEEMEKDLRSRVSRDSRAEKTKSSFIAKIKKDYNYTLNEAVIEQMAAKADTNVFNGTIKLKKKMLKSPLVTVDGKVFSVNDFLKHLKSKKGTKSRLSPADYVRTEARNYGQDQLLKYEDSKLEQKHTPFRLLMNEYREGILLFELSDQKVWSRAVKDTLGLEKFYEENKTRFMWPDRVEAVIYTCADATIAARVRKMIVEGKSKSEIAAEINQATQLNLQVEEGLFSKDDKEVLTRIPWTKGLSNDVTMGSQVLIVDIREIRPSSPKRLNEARGLVASEYQNYLEQEWIKELRTKYPFEIHKDVLYTIH